MEKAAVLKNKRKDSYITLFIFIAFFLFLLVQQRYVYLYLDDYGYASLSYINVTPGVDGTHFTFSQFLQYYWLHYLNVTGRVFFQSFASLILSGDLWVARIAQSVMLTLLVYVITRIVAQKAALKKYLVALIVCCVYGLLEIFVIDKSIFWFSAAVTYVWSLPLVFLVCYLVYANAFENRALKKRTVVLLIIIAFFASTAQEQVAFSQVLILALLFFIKLFHAKKLSIPNLLILIAAVGGLLFVVCAPATSVKVASLNQFAAYQDFSALPLMEKINLGMYDLIKYVFSKNFCLIILALLLGGTFASYKLIRQKTGNKIVNIISFLYLACGAVVMLVYQDGIFQLLSLFEMETLALILCTALIGFLTYVFSVYFIRQKKLFFFLCFIAAWLSVFPVMPIFEPVIGRSYIPFVFLLVLVIGDIFVSAVSEIRSTRMRTVCLLMLFIVALANMASYTLMFRTISHYHVENNIRIARAQEQMKNGEDVPIVYLRAFGHIESDTWKPNEGRRLFYSDPVTITAMREYYGFAEDVQIIMIID